MAEDAPQIHSRFTFQYVSILIRKNWYGIQFRCIYIPICFYFNATGGAVVSGQYLFTFQYVSILMTLCCGILTIETYLHSNMFLF